MKGHCEILLLAALLGIFSGCGGGKAVIDSHAPDETSDVALVVEVVDARDVLGPDLAEVVADVLPDSAIDAAETAVTPFDTTKIPTSDDFILGVAAHEPTSSGVLLWTRYTGSQPLAVWVFQQSESGVLMEQVATVSAPSPNPEGIVIAEVSGLLSHRRHGYFFVEIDGEGKPVKRSEVGTFFTALADDALVPITFAHTSCAKALYQPYSILHTLAKEPIAFFVFNGDIVYADDSKNEAQYLAHYRANWSDLGLRALRHATAFYGMLDDHEVDNNWDPETIDPKLLKDAISAYLQYMPIRPHPEYPNRLWRTHRWGRTLELIIIDSRTERRKSKEQYLSPEQMAWLKDRLLNSPAMFKFIVNTVPIAKFPINNRDGWSGYDKDRDDILTFIESNGLQHVYWLSGDMHAAMVFQLENGGYDLVASPIGQLKVGVWDFLQALPQVKFISSTENNYMLVTADPTTDPPSVTISIRNPQGKEMYGQTFPAP